MIIETLKQVATNIQIGEDAAEEYRVAPYQSSYAVIMALHHIKKAGIESMIVMNTGRSILGNWDIVEDSECVLRPIIQNKFYLPTQTTPAFRVFANGDVDQITISIDDETEIAR